MIIKVCGLTLRSDLDALSMLPIDWGGLIFVEDSPRYCGKEPFELPPTMKRVGVFRNESLHQMLRLADRWKLDYIQLHGDEMPTLVAELQDNGLQVIKSISVQSQRYVHLAKRYAPEYLLFDNRSGGSGQKFDWSWLRSYTGEIPFLLAGGIGPGDETFLAGVEHPMLAGFDLNSRFEHSPGEKDPAALYAFLHHELPR